MQKLEKILKDIDMAKHEYMDAMLGDDYNVGVKDMALTAKQIVSRSMNDDWERVADCLPEDGEEVLITYRGTDGKYYVYVDEYDHECGWATGWDDDIVAWKPLPFPYCPKRSKE